ncbi:hypothetical protein FRB98_006513 [Tulasnella sp. 332]|nr:hypothetical protein FRB98_006513 [Tulasnella sp. 332]
MERPLALHTSALSETEYTAYSNIISELIDGQGPTRREEDDWESSDVPIGETRGWIRGKYGVDAGIIDQACVDDVLDESGSGKADSNSS